jgi:hypothetical protein
MHLFEGLHQLLVVADEMTKPSWALITASAMWATQHDNSTLEPLLLPVLWNTARYSNMAEHDILGVKIPAERSPVV